MALLDKTGGRHPEERDPEGFRGDRLPPPPVPRIHAAGRRGKIGLVFFSQAFEIELYPVLFCFVSS